MHDWWTPADTAAWNAYHADRRAVQLSLSGLSGNVNGGMTATENLADLAGLGGVNALMAKTKTQVLGEAEVLRRR